MQGYFDYSIDFAMDRAEFTEEQIRLLRHGLSWAKDEMTMQDAREYKSKR
jgi:hypothetical protein